MATEETPVPPTLDELFAQASSLTGRRYVAVERALRDRGTDAATYLLASQPTLADPFARFMAGTIAAWIGGKGAEFEPMMERLVEMERRAKETPMRVPRADVAEGVLTATVEDRLVDFIALRLVKEPNWPSWKVLGALLYLERHKAPSALPALIRFASGTLDPNAMALAVRAIEAVEGARRVESLIEEARYFRSPPKAQP